MKAINKLPQSLHNLQIEEGKVQRKINALTKHLNIQKQQLQQLKEAIERKTPKAMTIAQIEAKLGHCIEIIPTEVSNILEGK